MEKIGSTTTSRVREALFLVGHRPRIGLAA
jgi:hypothetical protein